MKEFVEMFCWFFKNLVFISKVKKMLLEEFEDKFVIGEFVNRERLEFVSEFNKLIDEV